MQTRSARRSDDHRRTLRIARAGAVVLISLGACTGGGGGPDITLLPARDPYVLDDFGGNGLDPGRWTVVNAQPGPDPFGVANGRLTFAYTAGGGEVRATELAAPGFYSLRLLDFGSTNCELPGSHRGAFAALGLRVGDAFVQVMRDQNGFPGAGPGGACRVSSVFEALYRDPAASGDGIRSFATPVAPSVTAGRLGLSYDRTGVTFYFNPDPSSDAGWQTIQGSDGGPLLWYPGWSSPPTVYVRGWDPSGQTTFAVDDVSYVPRPPDAR